jgi:hypothetical protein
MINDLATESTTVHLRFPYCITAFIVMCPAPTVGFTQLRDMVRTLERLTGRKDVNDCVHLAEVIAFVLWDPNTGVISPNIPDKSSPLRIEEFSAQLEKIYRERYRDLPPHI